MKVDQRNRLDQLKKFESQFVFDDCNFFPWYNYKSTGLTQSQKLLRYQTAGIPNYTK